MNDSMSVLLATTILALGGLGLYMFKSSDDNQSGGNEEYNEDSLFGSGGLFKWGSNEANEYEDDTLEEFDEEEYKPRKRVQKTQKNRKSSNNSKRRY